MRYVIIGNSAAGISAAEAIRSNDKNGRITIISDEKIGPYCRILTTNYIAGEIKYPEMLMRDKNFYKQFKIELISGKKAKRLIPSKKNVDIDGGKKIHYDKLLIASGSSPTFPDVPGIKLNGVFGLRKIDDAKGIVSRIAKIKRAIVIGGGLVSCKAAYSLIKRGVKVTILIASNRILSQMLDNEGSKIILKRAESLGIDVKFGTEVKEILGVPNSFGVTGVILTDGTKINCGLVIVGKGVKPNTDFLNPPGRTGVKVEKGVVVNRYLNTNISNIYAAGDVAVGWDLLYKCKWINAMWPNAITQGRIAGLNMTGEKIMHDGGYAINIGEFFGIPAVSIGISRPKENGFKEVVVNRPSCNPRLVAPDFSRGRVSSANKYKKFVLKNNRIVGYINIGDVSGVGFINNLISSETDVASFFDDLKLRRNNISQILKIQMQ